MSKIRWRLALGLASLAATVALTLPAGVGSRVADIWPNGASVADVIWPNGATVADVIWPNGATVADVIWPNGSIVGNSGS